MSLSKGKTSVVNQTIILHSPQFSINNTFFEQNNKTNGIEKQNMNQDKTTLHQYAKQQSQQQTGNYYQINQVSTINNNTTITCSNSNTNNSSSTSSNNKNYENQLSFKHPSSIVHPQITQQTFSTMTIPAVSSIIPSNSRTSTIQQPPSQSLNNTHGQQFIPPPPPPSKNSRGMSRPMIRHNQQVKRHSGNVSPLRGHYENKLTSNQVSGIRSNSQYPTSINRWVEADEDVLINGELQRIQSQDKRSRERLEKNSQLQQIYGRSQQSRQQLFQQQQILGYQTVQNSYAASIDQRNNNIQSRQSSVQRRRGQNLTISQRPQDNNQTISQNRQQVIGTELIFLSISNERSSLMNGRNQRFDSISFSKKTNVGGQRQRVQSSERPTRIAQIGGGVYLPIAAPMSAMEIGEQPRARSSGRSRSQGRGRNAKLGNSYEDGREEAFSRGSFLNEIAQKYKIPMIVQNQEINPQKLLNQEKISQQQQLLQQNKQRQDLEVQQQQQIRPQQNHPGRCLVVSSGKQSDIQMQDQNIPAIVEIPIPRPLLKNDSKENINLQSEQTSDFFDAYVRGLIQTDNFSTSNYDRLSSSQVERNHPPKSLEDNNLFLFEKNLDPNRSFSDLPESGSATAYDGLSNGVGFFSNSNPKNSKQTPDSCKIKKIMQFYTGQITKNSNQNNNHNPTFSSINSFGLKASGENNTTPKDLSQLQSPSLVVAQHSRELEYLDVVDQSFGSTFSQFLPPHPPRNQEDCDKKKESTILNNFNTPLVTFCDSPRVMEKQQPQLLEVNSKKQFRRNTSKIRQRNNLLNRDTLRDSNTDEQQATRLQQMKEHLQLESYDKSTLIPLPPQANLPRPKHNRNQLNTILFNHAIGASQKPNAGQENSQRNNQQNDIHSIEKSECSERNLPDKSDCSERNPVEEMSTVQKDDYDEREYDDEFENEEQIDRTRQTAAFNSHFDQMITNSLQNYLNTSSDCNRDSQKSSQ